MVDLIDLVDPATAGGQTTYNATVTNQGPNTASRVLLTQTLSAGTSLLSVPSGCVETETRVLCSIGDLASGQSAALSLVVRAEEAGVMSDTVFVLSDTTDPDPSNNSTAEQTSVNPVADLAVTQVDDVDPIPSGEVLVYHITLRSGPVVSNNVVLTDTIPAGMSYVSALSPQGTCAESVGVVTCQLGSVSAGATVEVEVAVTPLSEGLFTNVVSVTSPDDMDISNNTSMEDTRVVASLDAVFDSADLGVSMSADAASVVAGDELIYTVRVSNVGPDAAQGVVLSDLLPVGIQVLSVVPEQGVCLDLMSELNCDVGGIPNGASVTVTITGTAVGQGLILNVASVSADT